ncbi:DEAD/DEAH box helicase [Microbacterium sp. SCN 69-37]
MLAVATSDVQPLPHQIRAVYGELLPRTPLRFLLADDPGAGKTIMAGLYIKELILRDDVRTCLVVAPGGLVEQWQDELALKFGLEFEILAPGAEDTAPGKSVFEQKRLLIARMDQLARNEVLLEQIEQAEFDLVVVDEAHRMSASWFSGELKASKRFQLGELLSERARHFLLMTATPHNGKEEDFQTFLSLLDRESLCRSRRPACADRHRRRADEAHVEGEAGHLRGASAVPRADRRDRLLPAVARRAVPLRRGHRVRPQRDEPRRPAGGQAEEHGRLRAHGPPAASRVQPGGDLPVAAPPHRPAGAHPRRPARRHPRRPAARSPRLAARRRPRQRRLRHRRTRRGRAGGGRGGTCRRGDRSAHRGRAGDRDRGPAPIDRARPQAAGLAAGREVARVARCDREPGAHDAGRQAAQAHRLHRAP